MELVYLFYQNQHQYAHKQEEHLPELLEELNKFESKEECIYPNGYTWNEFTLGFSFDFYGNFDFSGLATFSIN